VAKQKTNRQMGKRLQLFTEILLSSLEKAVFKIKNLCGNISCKGCVAFGFSFRILPVWLTLQELTGDLDFLKMFGF
jgi:hypothetical protein